MNSGVTVSIHGVAYDVKDFLSEHPGGKEVLLKFNGADATADFDSTGHSARARQILSELPRAAASDADGAGGVVEDYFETPADARPQLPFSLGDALPVQPTRLPLIGNTLDMILSMANPQQAFLAMCTRLRRAVRVDFGLFRNPMVAIIEPNVARAVVEADNVAFLKGPGYAAIHTVTPFHLLVTEGDEWRRKRREVVAALHTLAGSATLLATVHAHGRRLAEEWLEAPSLAPAEPQGGEPARAPSADSGSAPSASVSTPRMVGDLPGRVRRCALALISEIVLGEPLPNAEAAALATLTSEWHLRVTDIVPLWKAGHRSTRCRRATRCLFDYIRARVQAMRRHAESSAVPSADDATAAPGHVGGAGCLAALCWLHLPDEAVGELAFTLLAMGHENVSSATSWAFAMLCSHPEQQQLVAEEARGLPEGGDLAAADLAAEAAPALDRFVKEALRLFPPIPMLSRRAALAGAVGGLQATDELLVNPYVLHRLPWLWRDAARFDPSRWKEDASAPTPASAPAAASATAIAAAAATDGEAAPDVTPPAYMPFGGGPRGCPGRSFALFELKLLVVAVLQRANLSFAPSDVEGARECLFVSLRPAPFAVVVTPVR